MNKCLVAIIILCMSSFSACSKNEVPESEVFTLYSTNYPNDFGRSGVATFDLAREPLNSMMCQEAADMHQADFEKRRSAKGQGVEVKMRFWCEKGRFKK